MIGRLGGGGIFLGALLLTTTVSHGQVTIQIGQPAPPPPVVVEETVIEHHHHEGGPPPHAKAWGYRAKQRPYRYYPVERAYYDQERAVWFWIEGGNWRVGAALPGFVHVGREYVMVRADAEEPYRNYEEHVKKYPPGQLKKMGKGKKNKKKWEEDE
jgi:hypothetical protein